MLKTVITPPGTIDSEAGLEQIQAAMRPHYPRFSDQEYGRRHRAIRVEMERQGMILNLHGEVPSQGDVTVLSAEERFLPTLLQLHEKFPKLRIILEHCTTAAAVEAVKKCGPTVAGTSNSNLPPHISPL